MKPYHLVITCEHAGNAVPEEYAYLFQNAHLDLNSHKGYDPGALEFAMKLKELTGARLFTYDYTRLLIESNRSLHHPDLFSAYSRVLPDVLRNKIIAEFYLPYRNQVEKYIRRQTAKHGVIHLSIHSFTPVLNGIQRTVDIGLLFDENRSAERLFCHNMKDELTEVLAECCTMLNVPYQGADDGFTTYLRQKFDNEHYLGIEIEVNQRFYNTLQMNDVVYGLHMAIQTVLNRMEPVE